VLTNGSEIGALTVILAAGAIHSPAILLRSGVDRPAIGFGLQDHPSAPITLRLRAPVQTNSLAVTALARFSSGDLPADLQLLPLDHLGSSSPEFGLISVALMFVQSRGRVQLRSLEPTDEPEIDFALLSADDDVRRLIFGIRQLRQLLNDSPLVNIAEGFFVDDKGTQLEDLSDDDNEIANWLRRNVGDYVHASGTCAMGNPQEDSTVVDPLGRVVGYESLKVCDASIFPRLPRANTHFPVMMTAEVLADRWINS
jgi:choline dehydrogenase/5-(hydroxymethyl)furfural/furfural oxidase